MMNVNIIKYDDCKYCVNICFCVLFGPCFLQDNELSQMLLWRKKQEFATEYVGF